MNALFWTVPWALALMTVARAAPPTMPTTVPATRPTDLRVGTFNVRNSFAPDLLNAWRFRRELFVHTVRGFGPDVLGLQEVLPDQQAYLAEQLNEYASVATFRDDGKTRGEASSVFYRKDRFDLADSGTFWLSQTPEKPGSMGWDAACTRVCTWARLRDKTAGRDVLMMNTHLDHVGRDARKNSVALLARRAAELGRGAAVVLMGDFNAVEDGPVYAALLADAKAAGVPLTDTYRAAHPQPSPDEASYHGFADVTKGQRIDWTFTGPGLSTVSAHIDHAKGDNGRYPSDHYPVWCVLRYDPAGAPRSWTPKP